MNPAYEKRAKLLSAAEDAVIDAKRWNALCPSTSDLHRPGADGITPDQRIREAVARARNLLAALGDE